MSIFLDLLSYTLYYTSKEPECNADQRFVPRGKRVRGRESRSGRKSSEKQLSNVLFVKLLKARIFMKSIYPELNIHVGPTTSKF